MFQLLKNSILSCTIFWLYLLNHCSFELNTRVVLISLERPICLYEDRVYNRLINVTSRRPDRSDRTHYIHMWLELFKDLGNTTEITVSVSEFMSNQYKPTFVGLRLTFCDFFGHFMNLADLYYTNNESRPMTPWTFKNGCYLKTGIFYFANMTLPMKSLPENFPFEKGRVFVNHSYKSKVIMTGQIDLELKTLPIRKYKGRP